MSLRDVERVLDVMCWFYRQTQTQTDLFIRLEENETDAEEKDEAEGFAEDLEMEDQILPPYQVGTPEQSISKNKYMYSVVIVILNLSLYLHYWNHLKTS